MRRLCISLMSAALIAGCSQSESETGGRAVIAKVAPIGTQDGAPEGEFGFAESLEQGPNLFGEQNASARLQALQVAPTTGVRQEEAGLGGQQSATAQQIAYSYGYGFQISSGKIPELQRAHTALCESMGPKCRVMRTSQANGDGFDGFGEINLQVAASEAGGIESKLSTPAEQLGGTLVSSVREGEDLSESIIDTEARLKSRLLLREKLTAILQGNRGSVGDLIEAEKAIADVNAEIDEARNKLANYRNRISYSNVRIQYEPYFGQGQLGFGRPIMTALRSVGTTLGMSIAALVYLIVALTPVIAFLLALRWVLHRFGLRIRFWRKRAGQSETDETAAG